MLFAVTHRTVYTYPAAASMSHHVTHLRPRETARQKVLDHALDVNPAPSIAVPHDDYYGNATTFFTVGNPHRELKVISRSRIEVTPKPWPDPAFSPAWETVRDACVSDALTPDSEAGEFLYESPFVPLQPAFADYALESFTPGRPLIEALLHFTARIYHDFKFDPKATTISTPVETVFKQRRGVCQDFAHFGLACLRSIGLPTRYVSGYLETLPPPGKPRLVGADASHAWFSVWSGELGWIDADPTNNVQPGDRHITVAWGRDYRDVSPLRGVVVGGGEHTLAVGVDVARL